MVSVSLAARMVLAALVAGATAGTLLVLSFWAGPLLFGSAPGWWTFRALTDWLPIGFLAGLLGATLPAFLAGSLMWSLGASVRAARHPLAWAAAGAGVGGALWTMFGPVLGEVGRDGLDPMETALLAAALFAGAGSALAFLAAMRLTGSTRRKRPSAAPSGSPRRAGHIPRSNTDSPP